MINGFIINARKDRKMADSSSPNYAEFSYEQKNEGKVKVKRTLMVVGYILFILSFFVLCLWSKILYLFAIGPLLLYILVLCTWRLVKYDCYWEFGQGILDIGTVKVGKNGRRKTPRISIHVKEACDIGYYESPEQIRSAEKVYDFSASPRSDKRIYLIFNENGKTAAAIIEGTARLGVLLTSFCDKAHDIKGKQFHG